MKQVPRDATAAMVNGPVRQIIMWIGFADKDGASLIRHLRNSGQWRDWMAEYLPHPEDPPTKNTLSALIWRAMWEEAQ